MQIYKAGNIEHLVSEDSNIATLIIFTNWLLIEPEYTPEPFVNI